ncbi:MAG TPA: ATP-binding protein [Brumimicrobium sp.]|nr:ATP-binding protein [Brumimicrobium sp.]
MKTTFKEIEMLSFSSDLNNIGLVEKLIDEICGKYKIQEDFYGNILIAVTEAINNSIQHGNDSDQEKQVSLSVLENTNEIKFVVCDEGKGFAYDKLPDPTAPENIEKESGRGIFLMKALADDVEFEENGSKVILTFHLEK